MSVRSSHQARSTPSITHSRTRLATLIRLRCSCHQAAMTVRSVTSLPCPRALSSRRVHVTAILRPDVVAQTPLAVLSALFRSVSVNGQTLTCSSLVLITRQKRTHFSPSCRSPCSMAPHKQCNQSTSTGWTRTPPPSPSMTAPWLLRVRT